jgi:hypothetical protein
MSEKKETAETSEKTSFVTFKKTWKLFGFFSFSIVKTISEQELIDDVSQKVLDKINAELNQRFAPPPRKQQ